MTEKANGFKRELDDGELAGVNGGRYYPETYYDSKEEVPWHFRVGNEVEVRFFDFWTFRCVVKAVKLGTIREKGITKYYERYEVEPIEDTWYYPGGVYDIWDIQVREMPK